MRNKARCSVRRTKRTALTCHKLRAPLRAAWTARGKCWMRGLRRRCRWGCAAPVQGCQTALMLVVAAFAADTSRAACAQTTIMAVTYDGGVVLGADSRTSTGAAGLLAELSLSPACAGAPAASCCCVSRVGAAWFFRRAHAPCVLTRRRLGTQARTWRTASPTKSACSPKTCTSAAQARCVRVAGGSSHGQPLAVVPFRLPRPRCSHARCNPNATPSLRSPARLPTRKPSPLMCATTSTNTGARDGRLAAAVVSQDAR